MTDSTLRNSTVVITGASSGIGMAASRAFAAEGADLVIASRSESALKEVARECKEYGARVEAVVTDVTEYSEVAALAERAAQLGGGVDIWINNAGTGVIGRFAETPMESHDQVVRTNLMGYLHGAHAALPYFLSRGRGILMNNISLGAWLPTPFAASYAASKYGLEGFSQSLRAELAPWPDIHVCDIYPSVVNTPGLARQGAPGGRRSMMVAMAMSPDAVARAMIRCAKRPRPRTRLGSAARLSRLAYTISPLHTQTIASALMATLVRKIGSRRFSDDLYSRPASQGQRFGADPAPRKRARNMAVLGVTTALGLLLLRSL